MGMLGLALILAVLVIGGIALWWAVRRHRGSRAEAASEARERLAALYQALSNLNASEYLASSDLERWRSLHQTELGVALRPDLAHHLPASQADEYRFL